MSIVKLSKLFYDFEFKAINKSGAAIAKEEYPGGNIFLLDNIWLGLNNFFVIDANISVVPKDFMIL